jgi:hypothetical protein
VGSSCRTVVCELRKVSRTEVACVRGGRKAGGWRGSLVALGPVNFGGRISCFGIGKG